jgi:lipopolysaccharide transport system permease protein
MSTSATSRNREIVIRPAVDLGWPDLAECYRYRHILTALVWRNIRTQFDETYVGLGWVCVRPLLLVLVFVVFRRLANADAHVLIPYPLYIYSGLILWYYLIDASTDAAGAVKADAHLITKVYYPRLFAPLTPVLAHLASLAVAAVPLAIMAAWYGLPPGWRLLLVPAVLVQCAALSLGIGALVASLTLASRDWERTLGFAFYLGLFVSPVIYGPGMIPEAFRPVYFANPVAGTLLAFRACVFAAGDFPLWQWTYSVLFSAAVLLVGFRMFRSAEADFADRL